MFPGTSIKSGPAAQPIPVPIKRGFSNNLPNCAMRTKLAHRKLDAIRPKFAKFPPKLSTDTIKKVGNKWVCPFCPFTHKDRRQLKQIHVAKHFLPRYKCVDCSNTWHIRSQYRQHYKWQCKLCDYRPLQFGGLRSHLKKIHSEDFIKIDAIRGYIEDDPIECKNLIANWRGKNITLARVESI